MALAYVDAGNVAAGTTSLSVPCPATVNAGDLLVLTIANKYPTNGPSQPTNWTTPSNNQYSGGAGAAGVDSGTAYITIFTKIAAGTEGGTNVSVTLTGSNTALGRIFRFSVGAGNAFGVAIAGGSDNSAGTAWSVTAGADPGVAAGDILLIASALNGNTDTGTSQAVTQTGVTFGTMAERQDSGTNNGEDCSLIVTTHPVDSGAGSAAPVYTMTVGGTGSATAAGATAIVRIREIVNQSLTPTVFSQTDTFGAATVTAGAVDLTPTVFGQTDTFGAATVSGAGADQGLTATTYTDGDAFQRAEVALYIQGDAYLLRDQFTSAQNPLVDGPASAIGYRDVTGTSLYAKDGRLRGGDNNSAGRVVYNAATRVGGRTFTALITPDDAEGGVSLWLAETAGVSDGYGIRFDTKTIFIIEPDGNTVTAVFGAGGTADPGRAISYLVGITLNEGQGAIYWLSALDDYTPGSDWPIPQYPTARILFISQLGTFNTVYPTLYGDSGFNYFDGIAIEDARLLDIAGWGGADGMALAADRFDRADSSTTLGASWTADAGTWGISSNQAYAATPVFNGRAYMDAGQADVWVVAQVTSGSDLAGWFGLLLRRSASGTFMRLYNNGSANIYLQKFLTGSYDGQVTSTYAAFSTSQTKRWLAGAYGDSFRVFLNGDETVIEPTTDADSRHTEGNGFGLFGGDAPSGQRWDYFAVYPITLTLPAVFNEGAYPSPYRVGAASINADTFTDTNGTALASHTPDTGSGWTSGPGTWTIQSNAAQVSTVAGNNYAYVTASSPDVEVSVDVTMPGTIVNGVSGGLLLRWTDADNYVYARLLEQGANDEIEVWEVNSGVLSLNRKAYLGSRWSAGATYNLRVTAVRDTLHVYLDNIPQLTVLLSAAPHVSGRGFGLYQDNGYDTTPYDNFTIKLAGDLLPTVVTDSDSFGTAVVEQPAGGQNLTAAIYTDSDSFGAATVTANYPLTATTLTDSDSFGAATISVGAVNLTATVIDQTDAFGAASITTGAVDLTPSVIGEADTFGAATISVGAVGLTATLVVDGDSFGSASISVGAVDLAPSVIGEADTFGAASVAFNLTATVLIDGDAFGAATISVGAVNLTATVIDQADTFGAAIVNAGEGNLYATRHIDGDTFGAASITTGAVDLTPSVIGEADTFGAASLSLGLTAAVYTDPDSFGAANVAGGLILVPTTLIDSDSFGGPTVIRDQFISATTVIDGDAFGAALVGRGAVNLATQVISSTSALYAPIVASSAALLPSRLVDVDTFGAASITTGPVTLAVSVVTNSQNFGAAHVGSLGGPQFVTASCYVDPDGFGSHRAAILSILARTATITVEPAAFVILRVEPAASAELDVGAVVNIGIEVQP